jgi:hypothetical protein
MALRTADGSREQLRTPDRPRSRRGWRRAGLVVGLLVLVFVVVTTGGSVRPFDVAPPATQMGAPPEPVPTASVAVRPVNYWAERFLGTWDYELRTALPQSRSPDSWDHYSLAYDIDANTAMYRATGEARYMDRALLYLDNVVGSARVSSSLPTSQYRDHYLGWVSKSRDLDRPGVEVPLYESYLWRYATTTLRVIRQTPALYDDPTYRARYDNLLGFAEVNIFEKWYSRGANDNVYRSRTHMAAHWATIALNLSVITTDPQRQARYRTVVDDIDQHLPNAPSSLRKQMRQNPIAPSAYFWSDEWGSFRRPGQDVSHGNGVVSYLVEANEVGTYWTATDMARLTALLQNVIWPRNGVFPAYLDGTGVDNGWWSDGFVKLGRFNAAVQDLLSQHPVVNGQFLANMALNARILT